MTKPEEIEKKDSPVSKIQRIQESEKDRETKVSELNDIVQDFNKKINELEQEEEEIKYKIDAPYGLLVGVSDLHYGNVNVNMDFVDRVLGFIEKHENVWCFLNGDILDNWVEISPKGGIYEQTIRPEFQYEIMKQKLEPIKDSILAIIYGNHEGRSQRAGEENSMSRMAKDLDIGYLGAGGRIEINLNGITYKVHARHRFHYYSSLNPTHPCKRLVKGLDQEADIAAIGHNHDPVINKIYIDKPRTLIRYGAAVPSTRYSRYKGYAKTPLVAPSVLLNAEKKAHDPLMNLELAKHYIESEKSIDSNNQNKSFFKNLFD